MALIRKFTISNFKGIEYAEIAIEDKGPAGRFVTLIGLNESGKTTVLEALSHSSLGDLDTVNFLTAAVGQPELNDIIPKKYKAAFTGNVDITAYLVLSDDEVDEVRKFIKDKFDFTLKENSQKEFIIRRRYEFLDSKWVKTQNTWTYVPLVRKKSGRSDIKLSTKDTGKEWEDTSTFMKKMLPSISYFPTFLVDFPRRIYLEGSHGETDSYYRKVIGDLLAGVSGGLSIEKHILDRAKPFRSSKQFSSDLRLSPQSQQIDAVVQKVTEELNRVILGAWNEIFVKAKSDKRFNVEWHIDEGDAKSIYLEIYMVSNGNRYYISERSLGFRWFFSFLLFTQFRSARAVGERVIMLFDEPASHLHARAQQRLLESFAKIAEPNNIIIYSTHSHYLINPLWLEKAYIVLNDSSSDDDPLGIGTFEEDGSITVAKYRNYVKDNPGKTTYFQPALDALDYGMPALSFESPVVVLEGKFDFYPFKVLQKLIGQEQSLRPIPAVGADGMMALIGILRGWGIKFVILLDDDKAGVKAKQRYQKQFLLSDREIVTLSDLDVLLSGQAFEGIFRNDVSLKMKKELLKVSTPPEKQEYYLLFQKIICGGADDSGLLDTSKYFALIYEELLKLFK